MSQMIFEVSFRSKRLIQFQFIYEREFAISKKIGVCLHVCMCTCV